MKNILTNFKTFGLKLWFAVFTNIFFDFSSDLAFFVLDMIYLQMELRKSFRQKL